MTNLPPWDAATIGVVLALLIGAAGAVLYLGLKQLGERRRLTGAEARLEALLAEGPAEPLVVAADGALTIGPRLAQWLGLDAVPGFVEDLLGADGAFEHGDAEPLRKDLAGAQRAGRGFRRPVRARGAARALLAVGMPAGRRIAAPGAAVVWFFDASESQGEIARLSAERDQLANAFDALAAMLEAAPLPMWYRDAELRLSMVNIAYVRAVEAGDAADVVARQLELIEGQGTGGPLAGAARARETGEIVTQIVPATIGGARRSLSIHDVPLPNGGVAGYAVDVDELEQAHSQNRRFVEAQRAMLDRLSAGVAQFGPDRALAFCNVPFRRIFAMRPEWLADRPEFDRVLERMREAGRLPEVRDFPGWKADRRQWFTAAAEAQEENWHLPGGTHLRVVAQPLPDGGLLLIFEDRTEEVQLASARDTLLRVRAATFENLFEAVGVFAADGRLQIWNNKFRTLWGLEEPFLAGHPRVDALAREAAARLANPQRADLIGELVRSATQERQQRQGRVAFADGRHFEFAAVPLPDGNALFAMLDISDSRRMERALRDRNEALEEADRVKTAFVANISYELRTPLTSITGFAEMLEGGYAGALTVDAAGYVEAILESSARLRQLIDDVLDLTGEGGGQPLDRRPFEMAEACREAAATVAGRAIAKGIDLAVDLLPSAGRMQGDRRRIVETVEHLLDHAVMTTPSGGRVLLHADGNVPTARIVVSDDGPGMDEAAAGRAFERFAGMSRAGEGGRALGLGLPLAKRFVEAHGGTIQLVSEPGEGTLVTVELPRK